jgi:hypothetical protein
MKTEQHETLPVGADFLALVQETADAASENADEFMKNGGKRLPASMVRLGNLLSYLYRLSCCAWGCSNGDHTLEWLAGRVVNQSMAAHRLVRAANYDEALMLIRGMGEVANLLWLFMGDKAELASWQTASRKERMNTFGPAAVRQRVEKQLGSKFIPIDQQRYQRLCEVGTHPVPGFRPGHFSGTGRPVVGGILQQVGVFVCMTELGYAVSMCSRPLATMVGVPDEAKKTMIKQSKAILGDLGAFTILNYEELLRNRPE